MHEDGSLREIPRAAAGRARRLEDVEAEKTFWVGRSGLRECWGVGDLKGGEGNGEGGVGGGEEVSR